MADRDNENRRGERAIRIERLKPGDIITFTGSTYEHEGFLFIAGVRSPEDDPGHRIEFLPVRYEGEDMYYPSLNLGLTTDATGQLEVRRQQLEASEARRRDAIGGLNQQEWTMYRAGLRADAAAYGPVWDERSRMPRPMSRERDWRDTQWNGPALVPTGNMRLKVVEVVPNADPVLGDAVVATYQSGEAAINPGCMRWQAGTEQVPVAGVSMIDGKPAKQALKEKLVVIGKRDFGDFEKKRWSF